MDHFTQLLIDELLRFLFRRVIELIIKARAELERLLASALQGFTAVESDPREPLRRRLNSKRLRGNTVLAEIEAAELLIVPKDGA